MGRQIPPAVGGGAITSAIECDERFPEGNGTMATLAEVHSDMNGAGKAASSTLRCVLEFTVTLTLPAITFDHCQYASDVATCAFDPKTEAQRTRQVVLKLYCCWPISCEPSSETRSESEYPADSA